MTNDFVRTIDGYNVLFDNCPRAFIQQSCKWSLVINASGNYYFHYQTYSGYNGRIIAALPVAVAVNVFNVANSMPMYGPLGGILCSSDMAQNEKQAIYKELVIGAWNLLRKKHDIKAMTLITNPIDPDLALYLGINEFYPLYIFHNFTQYIEIDKLFNNGQFILPNGNHRRNITSRVRRAREHGLYLRLSVFDRQLKEWYSVHEKRHKEIEAISIPYDFFNRLYFELGKNSLLYLVYHRDTIIGGLFIVYHQEIADAFMLSFDSDYKDMYPNYFIVYHALKDLQKKGVKIFNWQSSQSRDCGVYKFKEKWGSIDSEYCFLTWCPDPKPLLEMGIDEVKKRYAGNYVLPYGAFDEPDKRDFYKGE